MNPSIIHPIPEAMNNLTDIVSLKLYNKYIQNEFLLHMAILVFEMGHLQFCFSLSTDDLCFADGLLNAINSENE